LFSGGPVTGQGRHALKLVFSSHQKQCVQTNNMYIRRLHSLETNDPACAGRGAVYTYSFIRGIPGYMGTLIEQLELPSDYEAETRYVIQMKEKLAAQPENREVKATMVYKLPRELRGLFMAAVAKHGLTMTDVITLHIRQIIPVLQKARQVEVPGYAQDKRGANPRGRR